MPCLKFILTLSFSFWSSNINVLSIVHLKMKWTTCVFFTGIQGWHFSVCQGTLTDSVCIHMCIIGYDSMSFQIQTEQSNWSHLLISFQTALCMCMCACVCLNICKRFCVSLCEYVFPTSYTEWHYVHCGAQAHTSEVAAGVAKSCNQC